MSDSKEVPFTAYSISINGLKHRKQGLYWPDRWHIIFLLQSKAPRWRVSLIEQAEIGVYPGPSISIDLRASGALLLLLYTSTIAKDASIRGHSWFLRAINEWLDR